MDNSKIFITFFIIFFFVFGRGLDFVVSGFNNINEQSQRVSKESVATDFYHSVNYGINTINFELDNLVSNINTETKSTLDDIEIILTSITRRTNFVTTKESVATDFYHSVNYGLNTINFELDNLVSNINTETKSTLDDIEIILTSITRRTNFVTTKESVATDFYHSVNYGLNTINFELDNL